MTSETGISFHAPARVHRAAGIVSPWGSYLSLQRCTEGQAALGLRKAAFKPYALNRDKCAPHCDLRTSCRSCVALEANKPKSC